jgi:hypothetical protein
MKERLHYISLTVKGGNVYHQKGESLKLTERIVNIGETADCDIRYKTNYQQPEYYASIIKNEDGKSWRIVKRSQHIDICILGKGSVGYAHILCDGDIIQIEGKLMALSFHSHYDDQYDEGEKRTTWQWVVTGLLGLVAVIAGVYGLNNRQESILAADVEPLEESIYLVKVDSVRRLLIVNDQAECIQPTKRLEGEAPTGTAFLTTDGKLITARHCVEYWIGTNLDLTTKVGYLREDDVVKWAIEAETFNQIHEHDSTMQLQVFFSVFDFMGDKKYSFTSTDKHVHINKEKDGIFTLADFSQEYYWRSIRPYFNDRQMELGDILWIDLHSEQGKIKLACQKQLKSIKNGTKLMICGYPMTGIGDKRMTFSEGTIRRNVLAESENIFFESSINHGFSGGPLLMKDGDDIVAIGVVSRVDSVSSGLYKWAVPVSEIKKTKN